MDPGSNTCKPYMFSPPIALHQVPRSVLLPWSPPPPRATSRHSNLRPILRHPSLLACAMRCDSATPDSSSLPPCAALRLHAALHLRLHSLAPQKTGHCVPSQPSHPWPTYKFHTEPWLSLTPLVAVSSLSCLPILVRVIESGLGSGLGSVVRVRVRVRARVSPRDACAYATPARHAR